MTAVTSIDVRTGVATPVGVQEATVHDVDGVVVEATRAFAALAAQSPQERAGMLENMADAVDDAVDDLVESADRETALGDARLRGEVGRTSGQFRLFADVVRDGHHLAARIDRGSDGVPELRTLMEPLGVVGVFGASNFPLAFSVPGGDTASALAAGCAVVAKAHPAHPATSELSLQAMRRGLERSGVDPSAVELVHGVEAGRHLVAGSAVRAIGFTGSETAGRMLFDLASARSVPIPFYGELGSMNPVVAMPDVDPAAFGEGLAGSITLGAGQFCTKPGVVFVPAELMAAVREATVAALASTDTFTMLTGAIADAYEERTRSLDASLEVWTNDVDGVGASLVVTDGSGFLADAALRIECFGPTSVLVAYRDESELLALIGGLPGALTGTIHAASPAAAAAALGALRARVGRVVWNGFPTGVRVGWATQHGGPYPATTAASHTSVGAGAIMRWLRPVSYQDLPDELLPAPLQESNPWGMPRRVGGQWEIR